MRDFTRTTWVSRKAQDVWQPRIRDAAQAWLDLETLSIRGGLRRNALIFGEPKTYVWPYTRVAENRFAVGLDRVELVDAFARSDDETVGRLLGFPSCCREFFARTWGAGLLDTTYEMAGEGVGPIECNILGRWLGVRWVTHLPCSSNCQKTHAIGQAMHALMERVNPVAAWAIDAVLSWPVEWSALHGVAEIKYPVCKVSTRTTYTARKRVVRRHGTEYPEEGATGLSFPYRQTKSVVLDGPAENGFASREAMDRGHAMIIDALRASPPRGTVFDLGCGNGLLARRIGSAFCRLAMGVESDARKVHGDPNVTIADLASSRWEGIGIDTIVVSQRRFEEIEGLEARCLSLARQVLVYSYDEPLFAKVVQHELISTH